MDYNIQQWLPTTKKEVEQRGWKSIDVILFTGDAYVDHPSFGGAVIGRLLESLGLSPSPTGRMIYGISRNWANRIYFLESVPVAWIPW